MATFQQGWQPRKPMMAQEEGQEAPSTEQDAYQRRPISAVNSIQGSMPFINESDVVPGEPLGKEAFSPEIQSILAEQINPEDIEIKPDGAPFLPEIRYRKVLLRAFGPGGWCMIPRGPHSQSGPILSREYALYCHGRFVSQARGSTTIAGFSNAALASEAVRSNALMRCCKDLGIASELWDNAYANNWKEVYANKKTVTDQSGRMKVFWSKK